MVAFEVFMSFLSFLLNRADGSVSHFFRHTDRVIDAFCFELVALIVSPTGRFSHKGALPLGMEISS